MSRTAWRWACVATVAVQVVVLYWPRTAVGGGVPGLDKGVHLAVFAAVGLTAVLAGARWWVVVLLLVAHAVVSEVVQASLLPARSGDPWDVVADVAGVADDQDLDFEAAIRVVAAEGDLDAQDRDLLGRLDGLKRID